MTTTHVVSRASDSEDLEIKLDNAANKGWSLVSITPIIVDGSTSSFWVVFSKESRDD